MAPALHQAQAAARDIQGSALTWPQECGAWGLLKPTAMTTPFTLRIVTALDRFALLWDVRCTVQLIRLGHSAAYGILW